MTAALKATFVRTTPIKTSHGVSHAQHLHARQRPALPGRDRVPRGALAIPADLGRPGGAHARREALGQAVLRPVHPRGRDGRGHRGVRALLRGGQRRAAHPQRLPDRRRGRARDGARRARACMMRIRMLDGAQFEDARQILRDIDSLRNHTAFLFDKINFLMDATVGFINISQNKNIKIFSVASVALLPPTLVASIYGMNLQFPEFALLGRYAYPYVVALIFLSAAVPMWYCYKPGWLR